MRNFAGGILAISVLFLSVSFARKEPAMKILVVDDDELVRTVCVGMLRVLKHDAIGVSSGTEAIAMLAAGTSCDLLIMDESMPDLNGSETIRRLNSQGIRIPFITCTGRNHVETGPSGEMEQPPIAVLSKPFTLQRLQSALAAASS
jgi:CheY-like chemotaxis protein